MKIFKIFTKKDRKIANLEAKIKNRDKIIGDQARLIDGLKAVINSLEDDLKESREVSYELLQKTNKKKTTKKETK